MSTETADTDLDTAFEGGFADEAPEQTASAPEAAAPASPAGSETPAETPSGDADDELAGLPPKVRAMLAEFETVKQAAALVPTLEHKLRSAEGRVAALQKAMPAPPPPAPPKLEKVERVRAELPEVIDAIEEYAQHLLKPTKAETTTTEEPAAAEPSTLDRAIPDWRETVRDDRFAQWLDGEGADYASTVKHTTDEAVMLEAVTRYRVHQRVLKQRSEAEAAEAARLAKTRQSRAAAAAVPSGSGRRVPTPPSTLDDEFEAGFRS